MTCDRYRPLLALLVGNDLDSREAADVRQHLSECSCCQTEWSNLQASIGTLHRVARQTTVPDGGSLRPQVLKHLRREATLVRETTPGWFTVAGFATACAAVLWLTVSTPVFDFDFREPQLADRDTSPLPSTAGASSQYPQLQLVGTTQPPIPVQLVDEDPSRNASGTQLAPLILGGPRSF